MQNLPKIPTFITVHLGPPDSPAPNVTIPFIDYIKNVAAIQIFPSWPDNAIRAAVYPMVSFALNRVYNNYYRSQGYDFDITSSPNFDQPYIYGGDLFANINAIVDEQFNRYLVRSGYVEPYLAPYCTDKSATCDGFPLWSGVALAEKGYTPYQILTTYYGDDINIVTDVPFSDNILPYPGESLSLNDSGNNVRTLQIMLNLISSNYPSIPKIFPVNGYFGKSTENAVIRFQTLFGLKPDGVVTSGTWYKIALFYYFLQNILNFVSQINILEHSITKFPQIIQKGQNGNIVRLIQIYLAVISFYIKEIPLIEISGVYDAQTENAVLAFQKYFGLNPTGIVDQETLKDIHKIYQSIANSLEDTVEDNIKYYTDTDLTLGSTGKDVSLIQQYLSYISDTFPEIPNIPVTGYFGERLKDAVISYQQLFDLNPTGIIDEETWNSIALLYSDLVSGYKTNIGQYPGYVLEEGV